MADAAGPPGERLRSGLEHNPVMKKALFAESPPRERVPLQPISANAPTPAAELTRLSLASGSPSPGAAAVALTPASGERSVERSAEPPRSVLRKRQRATPGAANASNITFAASTKVDPSPSSLIKHSPRPPRWPAAQSPWLNRGGERSELPEDTLCWNTPNSEWHREPTSCKSRQGRTPATTTGTAEEKVHNELLAMRVAYCNMCGAVFLGSLAALLYAQGLLVSQYYKSLILAAFVGTSLRRPVHCVSEMLRAPAPAAQGQDASAHAAAAPKEKEAAREMPEWTYWRWLGAAYGAMALLRFPLGVAATAALGFSVYAACSAMCDTWAVMEVRRQLSDWRQVLAKLTVVSSVLLLLLLAVSVCAYQLVAELNMLRTLALDGSIHSQSLASISELTGFEEEEVVSMVRQRSSMLTEYMRSTFENLIGDEQLAGEVATVAEKLVLEALGHGALLGEGEGESDDTLSFSSLQEMYDGALGSSRKLSDQTQRLLSHLASHMYTLLQQGFGYVLGGIDYLFAFTLFSSWLWMCLDEDAIESTIDRVIVGGDTSARVKSVLEATAGILDSLAHTFLFHCAMAWLVFTASDVRLRYICTLLAGLVSVMPVFSPWAVIFAPLALRLLTASSVSPGAAVTMLSLGALSKLELCAWIGAACVWASGWTQRLLSRSIATRTALLLGETAATQSILLGFYAFGPVGVAVGPVLLALTNGLVKIYRDSVVFPLRCR